MVSRYKRDLETYVLLDYACPDSSSFVGTLRMVVPPIDVLVSAHTRGLWQKDRVECRETSVLTRIGQNTRQS